MGKNTVCIRSPICFIECVSQLKIHQLHVTDILTTCSNNVRANPKAYFLINYLIKEVKPALLSLLRGEVYCKFELAAQLLVPFK